MQAVRLLACLIIAFLLIGGTSAWRRRRRRRCASHSCSWKWSSCSRTCGGGTQYPVKTANQGPCGSCNMPSGSITCGTQCCPVNCHWYSWSNWGSCSRSCGAGTQTRNRGRRWQSCSGTSCSGSSSETRSCNLGCCPVHCSWASWSSWGSCSRNCGGGVQTRTRGYSSTASCGGNSCPGSSTETRSCNQQCCAVHCSWASWGSWGGCSAACGGGTQSRSRGYSVAASCGGNACAGTTTETRNCNRQCCPVHCSWAAWGNWGKCSQTCGEGSQGRSRGYSTAPSCGGKSCTGVASESRACNENCCPVDCSWGSWGNWATCSQTCGGGDQGRSRGYSPAPSCGGKRCLGAASESRSCNKNCCPVDCSWAAWGTWGTCSRTCGGGQQGRSRQYSPAPTCGGNACVGVTSESRSCNENCCPVDCSWTDWTIWSSCPVSCGGGTQVRTRGENPVASCGGSLCSGSASQEQTCNSNCCPVNCVWHKWGAWSSCTKLCGSGTQKRIREISIPSFCGGDECTGPQNETQNCSTQCCPVDCEWKSWSQWSACTKTCEKGSQTRLREVAVEAFCGGSQCPGSSEGSRFCNDVCCPVHCQWDDWSQWGVCSKSCETGWQSRQRSVKVDALCNGEECTGSKLENRTCNTQCCPVDCVLTTWTSWSECSHTCGAAGIRERRRTITQKDECGGRACDADLHQEKNCNRFCFNSGNLTADNCVCKEGWKGYCCQEDVNECDFITCTPNSKCFNSEGSYECVCDHGYTMSGWQCLDVDECHLQKHDCHKMAECINLDGQYTCRCDPGFSGNGLNCSDVDECSLEDYSGDMEYYTDSPSFNSFSLYMERGPLCHDQATCVNSYGSYSCHCYQGYQGDGVICQDVDECKHFEQVENVKIHEVSGNVTTYSPTPCSLYAKCFNMPGSYSCWCKEGYFGDGMTCNEIDECSSAPCQNGGTCEDYVDSFVCTCAEGYSGDQCQTDIDECLLNSEALVSGSGDEGHSSSGMRSSLCHPEATCSNIFGSYKCTCNRGYTGNGIECNDIDECKPTVEVGVSTGSGESSGLGAAFNLSEPCDRNASCNNVIGTFFCVCNKGYSGNGFVCEETDECLSNPCMNGASCVDMVNRFECECASGFKGTYCEIDIHECQDGTHDCDPVNGKCINTPGSHKCICKQGFSGDGRLCTDIDECKLGMHGCKENQVCINRDGDYACICQDGYEMKDGDCKDVDECTIGNHDCTGPFQVCKNVEGGYTCGCREPLQMKDGYCKEPIPVGFDFISSKNNDLPTNKESTRSKFGNVLKKPTILTVMILTVILLVAVVILITKIIQRKPSFSAMASPSSMSEGRYSSVTADPDTQVVEEDNL